MFQRLFRKAEMSKSSLILVIKLSVKQYYHIKTQLHIPLAMVFFKKTYQSAMITLNSSLDVFPQEIDALVEPEACLCELIRPYFGHCFLFIFTS